MLSSLWRFFELWQLWREIDWDADPLASDG